MNKYNNFSGGVPAGDSPMRYNKRPRYGTNNNGGNGSPRFKHQNPSGYQYSQNRKNPADSYQSNQYDNASNRNVYGASSYKKNLNHTTQKNHSSPYTHTAAKSSSKTVLNSPPTPPKPLLTQTSSATMVAQNNHPIIPNILDSSNYYGCNYFFPNYAGDVNSIATNAMYNLSDGINPLMWQKITSTPPPKLPQQNQPPLPTQEPPMLPPLPKSDNLPHLPPPPPAPATIISSPSMTMTLPKTDNNSQSKKKKSKNLFSASKTIVKMKVKRRAMPMRCKLSKSWCEADAQLALEVETTNRRKKKDIILIIRFPDPQINRDIVKCYSPDIESVHFQVNFAPRYCLVHLKEDSNVEKAVEHLSKIPFGTGTLSVEIKEIANKEHTTKLNEMDPLTLYVGNLPTTIACKTLKEHFPGALRIDIGFTQRMKYTRYAFIRYLKVQQAIEAYKRMLDAEVGGRTLTIRFRRIPAANEGNKDPEFENLDDLHQDLVYQGTIESWDTSSKLLSQTSTERGELISNAQEDNNANKDSTHENFDDVHPDLLSERTIESGDNSSNLCHTSETPEENNADNPEEENNADVTENYLNDLANVTGQNSTEIETNNAAPLNISKERNLTEAHTNLTSSQSIEDLNTVQVKSDALRAIKPDPDIDPDDIVIRTDALTSRFESDNNNIKQEEENVALYEEFFDNPTNQNVCRNSSRSEVVSLPSTTEESDRMSASSPNSLAEFLQTCQIPQRREKSSKKSKLMTDILPVSIKREPIEDSNVTRENLPLFSKASVTQESLKPEPHEGNEVLHNIKNKNSSAQNTHSHAKEAVPRQRTKFATVDNFENSYDADMVPSTALFFGSDCQSMVANTISDCNYDEFYETRASVSLTNVKREPSDTPGRMCMIENNKNKQRNEKYNRNRNKKKPPINSTPMFKSCDDNDAADLVPPQNLLGSYQPTQTNIKREMEYNDIFSVPFQKTNVLNEDLSLENICNNNDSVTSLNSPSNNIENIFEISHTNLPENNDEDVEIISDNLKRQSKVEKFSNLDLTNFFLPKQIDLVSFKDKPVFVTVPIREVSKIIDRDYLDKLYDQLDADSDSEL